MRYVFLSIVFSTALILATRSGVLAQDTTTPTPQVVGSTITAQESVILKEFFEKLNEATQSDPTADASPTIEDIVKDVIKTVGTASGGTENDSESSSENGDGDESENGDDDESEADDDDDDKGKKKKKDKKKGKGKDKKKDKAKGRGDGLPPGLQKQLTEKGQLPPGLQKRLQDSGALPPGLQASGLPEELEAELPDLPEGQQRVIVDNDILIIEEVTGRVLDALPDIIPPDLVPILNQLPTIFQKQ
ncbi:MAG: hypothetical protein HQ501_03065 [Rhodospirillales bacterium]|nr:hypothetical protein [Rhodospirillales bacterium]